MDERYRTQLEEFDINSLPDLDVCVLGALELAAESALPELPVNVYKRPLVLGSVNALATAQMLFDGVDAVFADENTYAEMLSHRDRFDGAVIVSASGGKHATKIAETLKERDIPTHLVTNTKGSSAAAFVPQENVSVFPKNREPYTYNTSTYLSMLFAKTGENPKEIFDFLTTEVAEKVPTTLGESGAYFITVPPSHEAARAMMQTKFDELFGARVVGRVFTTEEAKHAKTVVPSEHELFIEIGEPSSVADKERRLHVALPENAGHAAVVALGYFLIGHIQKQHSPYFKEHIVEYTKQASKVFGHEIAPIVE